MKEKIISILNDIDEDIVSSNSDNLLEEGVIDSFTIIEILTEIEDQLGIKIPDDQVLPENFISIDKIVELVENCKYNRQGA